MTRMNKQGADKIISVYWFVILFIVAAAIVYMVSVFYGKPYDVRGLEAQILIDKTAECLSIEGYLNENWASMDKDTFLEQCNINLNVEETYSWNDDQYYVEITISQKTISVGNSNLKPSCSLQGENLPVCIQKSIYTIDKQNNNYRVDILSIVRKTEKNV